MAPVSNAPIGTAFSKEHHQVADEARDKVYATAASSRFSTITRWNAEIPSPSAGVYERD